jgi:uncharacterized phage protein (TIGR01671 family)
MREILFRGKSEKFGNWIEGSLIVGRDLESGQLEYLIAPLSAYYTEVKKVIPETIGQYTGLTDKNGTKIFEGDILKGAWGTIFQVVYDDCYLGFRAKEKDGMHNCIDYYGLDCVEVIGNITDNSELLGGK